MAKRYALANYIVSIKPKDRSLAETFGETVSVGGTGSNLGSITVSRSNEMFSMKSYATGGYAIDKNLSKVGKVSIKLHQLSTEVQKFIKLCNMYYIDDYDGCTITVTDINNDLIANCIDCFINQASQDFEEQSGDQTWEFVVGDVNFVSQA